MRAKRNSTVRAACGLAELARRRLRKLNETSPEELEAEVEQARKEGYKLIWLPGLRIRIRDYSLKPPDSMTGE
jgi:hypothetical protein